MASDDLSLLIVFLVIALPMVGLILLQGKISDRRWQRRLARVSQAHKPNSFDQAQRSLRKQKHESSFFSSDRLRARLMRAGMQMTTGKYWLVCFGLTIVIALLFTAFTGKSPLLGLCLGIAAGFGLPHMVVAHKGAGRLKNFIRLFPDAIDLIVRGLRSGLPVAESITVVAAEVGEPVGGIFAQIAERIRLGVTLEKSLTDAARELNSTEFNFFVTSIILQRETGGNLGEILSNLSSVLRARGMMRLKIRAMSSEARASGYIVGALPFLVMGALMFVSPDYMAPLIDDSRGNVAAFIAAAMMSTGAFVMNRMTKFEI